MSENLTTEIKGGVVFTLIRDQTGFFCFHLNIDQLCLVRLISN